MKKLIALSLAASSLVMGGSAMALPDSLEIRVDGSNKVQRADCYFLQNNGGLRGSCDYACDIAGASPRTSTLSVFFREMKARLHTQCIQENVGRFVATSLTTTNDYGKNQIHDVWDEKAELILFIGSEEGGMALVDSSPVALGLTISACP